MMRTLILTVTVFACTGGPVVYERATQGPTLQSLAQSALSQIDGSLRVP